MKKSVWRNLSKISFPCLIFATSRLAIFSLALVFIGIWPLKRHPSFLQAFSQWDGQWYLRILKEGYWYRGPQVQSSSPFFPLFPFLGKCLTFLGFTPELALFLVANLSCLGFFIVFWLLVRKDFGLRPAKRALFYYALSPISFIFSSLYTESLFLFLACFAFWLLYKSRFWAASLVIALASATRPFGVMLTLPLIFLAWRKKENWQRLFNYGWLSSLGFVFFSLYLYFKLGRWLPFFEVQAKAWHRVWTPPWESFSLFWHSVCQINPWHSLYPIAVFDLMIVLVFLCLLFYSLKRINPAYHLFVWPAYILFVSQPWDPRYFLPSAAMARYMFHLFPLVGLLGKIGTNHKLVHYLLLFLFASLMGPFSLAFFHGFWVE